MNLLKSILTGIGIIAGAISLLSGIVFLFYLVDKAFGPLASLVAMVVVGGTWLGIMMWSMDRPEK